MFGLGVFEVLIMLVIFGLLVGMPAALLILIAIAVGKKKRH